MAGRITDYKPGFSGIPGITKTAEGFQAAVHRDGAREVCLVLYKKGTGEKIQEIQYPEESFYGDYASLLFPGVRSFSWEYVFMLDGEAFIDPYAGVLITGGEGEILRCGYKTPAPYSPERKLTPPSETVIYKLHVRGFTMQKSSGVKKKGTFAGVKEKIPYLLSLGVTAVELMPCYAFQEKKQTRKKSKYAAMELVKERPNYWGYTGGHYYVPKMEYCATSNPQKEFASLVESLHEAGLECYMDFFFPRDMMAVEIRRVLHFWKREYQVDGFCIFGEAVDCVQLAKDPLFAETRLILPWMDEHAFDGNGRTPGNILVADMGFQCTARRFLKSDEGMVQEYMNANRRNPEGFGVLNYVANHDGFTLADAVAYDYRHNEDNGEENRDGTNANFTWNCGEEGESRKKTVLSLRTRQMKNLTLMLLLSQGTPLLYAGDEQGNSQKGNNNAWCQDNEIGWVDWSKKKRDRDFAKFFARALAFRKAHPVFHLPQPVRNMDYQSKGAPDLSYHSDRAWFVQTDPACRSVGMLYNGAYAEGEPEEFLYVAYNMYWEKRDFALPTLPQNLQWCLMADTALGETFLPEGEELPLETKKTTAVKGRSIQIFCARPAIEIEK